MAVFPTWQGDAPAVAQVDLLTIALTWATGDTLTLTIGTQTLVLTVGTDSTTTQVALAAKEMINGDAQTGTGDHTFSNTGNNILEFNEITATAALGVVTLTADTAGKPFTMSVTGDGTAGDGTAVISASIVNSGPNVWDTAQNWSTGLVPVATDGPTIDGNVSIKYGLSQAGATLASLTILQTFTAQEGIGLPKNNVAGYAEYRDDYLAIDATIVNIGQGDSTAGGSGRIKIDSGTVQTQLNLYNKGSRAEVGVPAVLWKGTHVDNVINVNRGDLGVAFFDVETAAFVTMKMGFISASGSDAQVVVGDGVDHKAGGKIEKIGGNLSIASDIITLTSSVGNVVISGTAIIATLQVLGGTCFYQTSGTGTAVLVTAGALLDFRQDARARTITTLTLFADASVQDPLETVTFSNPINLTQCNQEQVTLNLGTDITLVRA